MSVGHEKAPAGQSRGISEDYSINSLPDSVSQYEIFAQQNHGIYIVVAEIQCETDKRFRRRFYANLPSAQKAVDRAVMNGREVYLYIGQVSIVDGDSR